MAKLSYLERLDQTIAELEIKREVNRKLLREEFKMAYESIKPANLIRNAIHQVTGSKELRENIVNYALGMGAGYLTKKVLIRGSKNPVRNIIGNILQFGISNVVSKKSDIIRTAGTGVLKYLFGRTKKVKPGQAEIEEQRFNQSLYMDA